ncbi:putative helicase-like protein, partial [Golovinomyces cichoracearum]
TIFPPFDEIRPNDVTISCLQKPLPTTPASEAHFKPFRKDKKWFQLSVSLNFTSYSQELPIFFYSLPLKEIAKILPDPLRDHVSVEELAWALFIACKLSLSSEFENQYYKTYSELIKVDVRSTCREFPNMVSMQGLEKGTIGFQAVHELTISDRLLRHDSMPWEELFSFRRSFIQRKDKSQSFIDAMLVKSLIRISENYYKISLELENTSLELNYDLYPNSLFSSQKFKDKNDLHNQIYRLVDVLEAPKVLIDFSYEKWRNRLGQILWEQIT